MCEFIHLHVHSRYSLLDGAIRFPDLFARCRDFNMQSVAITDHGTMHGAMEFYSQARRAAINPIIGCEFYLAPGHRREKGDDSRHRYHLTLLAMDYAGYQNLVKLATIAQTEGFFYVPRIDKEILAANSEGVICLSGCLSGEVPSLILEDDYSAARVRAMEYRDLFGDRYYLEVQNHGLEVEEGANAGLIALSEELGVPVVATNNCHYLYREDAHAHEILLCIRTGRELSGPERCRFPNDNFCFNSPQEMAKLFSDHPEALATSVEIASRCNLEIPLGRKLYSFSEVPPTHFREKCREGLEKRLRQRQYLLSAEKKDYRERLEREIHAIANKEWIDYLLIVADYVHWARENGIRVGPGRGSAPASLVNFALGITGIDPIQHELHFERFLTDGLLPDLGVDFAHNRRDEVVGYLMDKYGHERVSHIVSFFTMKGNTLVRDVGKVLGISKERIAHLIQQHGADGDPALTELFAVVSRLDGLIAHSGEHAAAVAVSPELLMEHLPLCRGKDDKLLLTQYEVADIEKAGIPCFHLLSWKPLTVIGHAVRLVRKDNVSFDIDSIPLDDVPTFELLRSGNMDGIHRFDWEGLRELLVKLTLSSFQELCDFDVV